MYYSEKWIDGRLYFKNTLKGDWKPFTIEMYANRLAEREKEILSLQQTIDETIAEKNSSYMPFI